MNRPDCCATPAAFTVRSSGEAARIVGIQPGEFFAWRAQYPTICLSHAVTAEIDRRTAPGPTAAP